MDWGLFMKTKIIYISGSEIFQMSDVRAAFDTVRSELGLGPDTVLFGVPVDKEDALGGKFENADMRHIDAVAEPDIPEVAQDIVEPNAEQMDTEPEPVVTPKPKRTRKKVVAVAEEIITEPIVEPVTEEKETEEKPADDDAIIPILSVLGGEKEPEPVAEETIKDDADIDKIFADAATNINPVADFDAADIDDEIPTIDPEVAQINESAEEDDSLEKLLQSVQSLHEDKEEEPVVPDVAEPQLDETDLTLEKLANEFAESQDKIVNTTKSSARGGRIGKLKNILPFKKAKHNDSSLMGDLFGWAGVAANDEDFGIPEFFPTAAKK